jgi:CheY-like chemotaxis protein
MQSAANAGTPFPLVISDVHMPEMNGFDFSERVMGDPVLRSRIVLLTSGGRRGEAARCRELGISGYLTKPVRRAELSDAVTRALGYELDSPLKDNLITHHSVRQPAPGLRILVAEDNAVNQHLIRRLLEKAHHDVRLVDNGLEALRITAQEDFDLILMDVQMPEMDGLEATAKIRDREKVKGPRRRIFAMTAHAMADDRHRCLAAGMDGYLSKPVRPAELAGVLATVQAEMASSLLKFTAPRSTRQSPSVSPSPIA